MAHLLEARDLVKVFPGIRAVDGISFSVERGRCFGLPGPNGAGKTTTLERLEGITRPASGEIFYEGRELDRAYREDIGIRFQSTSLQDFQSVHESLRVFASLYCRRRSGSAMTS
jgi:ABC-2 type transport system ATP-binding protein